MSKDPCIKIDFQIMKGKKLLRELLKKDDDISVKLNLIIFCFSAYSLVSQQSKRYVDLQKW